MDPDERINQRRRNTKIARRFGQIRERGAPGRNPVSGSRGRALSSGSV